MLLTASGIGGERLEIRANHRGDAAALRMSGDFGGAHQADDTPGNALDFDGWAGFLL